jgi:phosphoenolpyruvate carboxykinase (GTP)
LAETRLSTSNAVTCGPTSKWMSLEQAHTEVWPLFRNAMRGRTMFVVPYLLGLPHSTFCQVGVEITDSPYIVLCLGLIARIGRGALDRLGSSKAFLRGLHSSREVAPDQRQVVHFSETSEIWSIGSGNAHNALFPWGRHALRLASVKAREEGWLAERMTLLRVTDADAQAHHIAVVGSLDTEALTSSSSVLPGWEVERLGGPTCWLRAGEDGRLWAASPDHGSCLAFGPTAAALLHGEDTSQEILFTNVALREGGHPWWPGFEELKAGEVVVDWRGASWLAGTSAGPAAHPNGLVMTGAGSAFQARPRGVPVTAIVFCGNRPRSTPLVYEARSWRHGVYAGATLTSGTDALGQPQFDPMGMRDFCGYNLGDYLGHWLSVGRKLAKPPSLFHVNLQRRAPDGQPLWPGGAANLFLLKWIVERAEGTAGARSTGVGLVPSDDELIVPDILSSDDRIHALSCNPSALLVEAEKALDFLNRFRQRLPPALLTEHNRQVRHLQHSLH